MPSDRPDHANSDPHDRDVSRSAAARRLESLLRQAAGSDENLLATLLLRFDRSVEGASSATEASWAAGLTRWLAYCHHSGVAPISPPPAAIVAYVEHLKGTCKVATIQARLWAVCRLHLVALRPSPTVHSSVTEALGRLGRSEPAATRRAEPMTDAAFAAMLAATPPFAGIGFRDRAMLRVAYDAKPTSPQLVGLDVADVVTAPEGAGVVFLRAWGGRAAPRSLPLSRDTILAIGAWTEFADLGPGPLFRSIDRWGNVGARLKARQLEICIKRMADAAGLAGSWSCMSFRAAVG